MSDTLQVGICALEITPPVGIPMAGFAARTLPSAGVHDPLYVRALVVAAGDPDGPETAVVVADVVSLSPAVTTAIREDIERQVGIPAHSVIVATTHTHGGPDTRKVESSPLASDYLRRLCDTAVRVVAVAKSRKVPARMLLGLGREETVGKNRRRPGGVMDPAVPTVRIEDGTGRVIGILCAYACHPVTLGPDNRYITADYPGAVVRTLEMVYPGAVAIFLTGCAGQINTGHTAEASFSTTPSPVRTFAEMTRLGRAVAAAAVRASEHSAGPRGTPSAVAPSPRHSPQVSAVSLPVAAARQPVEDPAALMAMARRWRAELADLTSGSEEQSPETMDRLRRWAAWAERIAETSPHPATVPLDVTAFRWGDIYLVGLPGEPFVEFALEIRERGDANAIVAGYANGVPGYVPHRSAYDEGGYEVEHAHRGYGAPSAFAPEAGEQLVAAALEAIAALGPLPAVVAAGDDVPS